MFDSLWISHHESWYHLFHCSLESSLSPCNLPRSKTKFERKSRNRTKQKEDSHHGSCRVARWVTPFTLQHTHLYLYLFIASSRWSCLRSFASVTLSIMGFHWRSPWIACPVSWFGSIGLFLHMLLQFTPEVDVEVGQLITTGEVYSPLSWLLKETNGCRQFASAGLFSRPQGWLTGVFNKIVSSSALVRWDAGSTVLCAAAGEGQG